jgi:exonuclease III
LANKFCRKHYKNSGVSIFIQGNIQFSKINRNEFCNDKDLEISAIKLHLLNSHICVVSVYRSPSGDCPHVISNLENRLNTLYSNTMETIICGDININYLNSSTQNHQLDSLLASYGLYSTVQFPTKICNSASTAIDNIFINKHTFENYTIDACVHSSIHSFIYIP